MPGERILIVDDETDLSEMLKFRLEAAEFEVNCAADGEEGLKKAQVDRPDLIILDVRMPKMDGLAVCQGLKSDDQTSSIPIIILSASTGEETVTKCLDLGANEYITKPLDFAHLMERIQHYLDIS